MSWFTWFDDVITSWDDNSLLNGGDGNDLLISVGDDNTLKGGTGDDLLISFGDDNTLIGGDGNDTLISYGDYNSLFGGSGYDILESSGNYNDLHGGSGADFVLSAGHHNTLFGGSGTDLVISFGDFNNLDGGGGADYLIAIGSNNTFYGGRGNDIIDSRYDSSDLIIYDGRTSDYSFEDLGYGKVRVTDLNLDNGNEGRDLIIGGEFLQFSNGVYDLASLLAGIVNTPPDVVGESVEVDEEGVLAVGSAPLTGNVLANDTDANGDALSLVATPAPQNILYNGNVIGSVVIAANGDYTVTLITAASQALGQGQSASATVLYDVTDGTDTVQGSLDVTVNGVNNAPTSASLNKIEITEDDLVDSITGEALTYIIPIADIIGSVVDPDHASGFTLANPSAPNANVVINGTNLEFTLVDTAFINSLKGGDEFAIGVTVDVVDPLGAVLPGQYFEVQGVGVNDAPTPGMPVFTTDEDIAITMTAAELLAGSSDPEGSTPTISSLTYSGSDGSLVNNGDGTYTFTPTPDFNGEVSLDLVISDGPLTANTTAKITVNAVNDAPVVNAVIPNENSPEDVAVNYTIPTNAFADVDGDVLILSATLADDMALPAWLMFDGATFTGTPPQDFNGTLNLKVTADDGNGGSVSQLFDLIIDPVNDAPVVDAVIPNENSPEDVAVNYTIPANAFADVDGDVLTLSASLADDMALPAWLIFDGATFTGTPPQDFNGTLNLKVTADDGNGGSVSQLFDLIIDPVNDAPVGILDNYTVQVGEVLTVAAPGILGNDTDVDGDNLTSILVSGTNNGTLIFNSDGSFVYAPNPGYVGIDDILYFANDGQVSSPDPVSVKIKVNAPAIIGGDDMGAVTEDDDPDADGFLEDSGTLTITDANLGDNFFQAGVYAGVYGNLDLDATGNWTYTADNTQAAIQGLGEEDTPLTDTIQILSLDGTPHDVVISILGVDYTPEGTNKSVQSVAGSYTFTSADFGFSDADGHNFAAVKITTRPLDGSLTLSGSLVSNNQNIVITDIDAGLLVWTPGDDEDFSFQVIDDSLGTNNTDPTPNFITIDVTPSTDYVFDYLGLVNTSVRKYAGTVPGAAVPIVILQVPDVSVDGLASIFISSFDSTNEDFVFTLTGMDGVIGAGEFYEWDLSTLSSASAIVDLLQSLFVDVRLVAQDGISEASYRVNLGLSNIGVGTAADEVFLGTDENDFYAAGDGNDILRGGANFDFLFGQSGDDILYGEANTSAVEYSLLVALGAVLGIDVGNANKTTEATVFGDLLSGGDGIDTSIYDSPVTSYAFTFWQEFTDGTYTNPVPGGGYLEIKDVVGTEGIDDLVVEGGSADIEILEFNGVAYDLVFDTAALTLTGTAADEVLAAADGTQSLDGAGGNDVLYGNAGDNVLAGGDGNDTFVFNLDESIGMDEILDFEVGDTLFFQNVGGDESENTLDGLITITEPGVAGDVVITIDATGETITLTGANILGMGSEASSFGGFQGTFGLDSIDTAGDDYTGGSGGLIS